MRRESLARHAGVAAVIDDVLVSLRKHLAPNQAARVEKQVLELVARGFAEQNAVWDALQTDGSSILGRVAEISQTFIDFGDPTPSFDMHVRDGDFALRTDLEPLRRLAAPTFRRRCRLLSRNCFSKDET